MKKQLIAAATALLLAPGVLAEGIVGEAGFALVGDGDTNEVSTLYNYTGYEFDQTFLGLTQAVELRLSTTLKKGIDDDANEVSLQDFGLAYKASKEIADGIGLWGRAIFASAEYEVTSLRDVSTTPPTPSKTVSSTDSFIGFGFGITLGQIAIGYTHLENQDEGLDIKGISAGFTYAF